MSGVGSFLTDDDAGDDGGEAVNGGGGGGGGVGVGGGEGGGGSIPEGYFTRAGGSGAMLRLMQLSFISPSGVRLSENE